MTKTRQITLLLPYPPSVNSLFPGKQRRYKSKAYEAWIREARSMLMQQDCSVTFDKPVEVEYRFGKPDKRKRDLDNIFKGPNDFLVSSGIIADDSLIHRISGEWADIEGCEVTIRTAGA